MLSNIVGVEPDPAAAALRHAGRGGLRRHHRADRAAEISAGERAMTHDSQKLRGSVAIVGVGRIGRDRAACRTSRRCSCTWKPRTTRWPMPASEERCRRGVHLRAQHGERLAGVSRHSPALRRRHAGRRLLVHPARRARAWRRSTPGLCEVALITHGESGYSRIAMPAPRWGDDSTNNQFELPYGTSGPATGYGFLATRHMHEYGTTSEQLAEVAVATRKWATLNPEGLHARSDHHR